MRLSLRGSQPIGPRTLRGEFARFRRNEDGANAIEFAFVSLPFLMFIFGLIGMAFNFFIQNSIENGMSRSARLIRTGEAQKADMTVSQFKQSICDKAGGWIKCGDMQIFVQKFPDWNSAQPDPCIDSSGNVVVNTTPGSDKIAQYSGTANDIVIVTGCYKWNFTKNLPFMKLGNMADKSLMMQTMTAFRAEPYTPPAP